MSDQWPPNAPNVKKAFQQACAASNDSTQPPTPQQTKKDEGSVRPVTAKQIEDLEKTKIPPQIVLKPGGARPNDAATKAREQRIAKMRERLARSGEQAKKEFNRAAGREI
jgi:hypothetical protein